MSYRVFAVVLAVIALFLHSVHTAPDYKGAYDENSNYKLVTSMKHDIFKHLTMDLTVLFITLSFQSKELISFDSADAFFSSTIGKLLIPSLGYLIFYQIVQPYFVAATPKW